MLLFKIKMVDGRVENQPYLMICCQVVKMKERVGGLGVGVGGG